MGTLSRYICPACHYHAEVTGGEDRVRDTTFETVVCLDCQKLYDIVTSTVEPQETPLEKPRPIKLRCPKRTSHKIVKWKEGDACPQCGSDMQNKGPAKHQ